MPPPLPDHLFDQADHLTSGVPSRPTDLRRAISNAYYGLFHFAITAAADMVLGAANQATARYALVYRSVDHAHPRATNPQKVALVLVGGFGSIADFARITLNLYELRILADYDPSRLFTPNEARLAVSDAREAIKWFQQGTAEQQQTFLTMLLFKNR